MRRQDTERIQEEVIRAVQLGEFQRARDLIAATADLAERTEEYKRLFEEQRKAREELEAKIAALKNPPLTRAIVLGTSPDAEQSVIVGLGGQRMEVSFAGDTGVSPADLVPGSEAWLNEDRRVVKVRAPKSSGEAGLVTAILDDGRLEVKGHGSEELIIETVAALSDTELRVGDRVRFDPQLAVALERLPASGAQELELESVPDVTYDQIGGLDRHIEQIREAIELPYLYNALFKRYRLRRPKGILLYGPPGCGKTMIAKAIANSLTTGIKKNLRDIALALRCLEALAGADTGGAVLAERYRAWQARNDTGEPGPEAAEPPAASAIAAELNVFLDARGVVPASAPGEQAAAYEAQAAAGCQAYFMSIKGPELLNKFVGETEHSIRKLFIQAKRHASPATPVIMFFDEIEALFRRRGSRMTSDMEATVVPQFLSEIDGVEELTDVIIIGATNRQDLLDAAILRPGRLDAKIKIDRPDAAAARAIFGKYLTAALPIATAVLAADGSSEQAVEAMIANAVDLLFDADSRLRVAGAAVGREPKVFQWRDFLSGAMIESIVSRAKRLALKRELDGAGGGLNWEVLRLSVIEEMEQNKDQLAAVTLNVPEEGLTIEVLLPDRDTRAAETVWLAPIERPWNHRH